MTHLSRKHSLTIAAATLAALSLGTPRASAQVSESSPVADAPKLAPPKIVTTIEPEYPAAKKAAGQGAVVVLTLTIDAAGNVQDAVVATSGGEDFDEAALAAAKALVFEPATKDGHPIAARIPWTFTFAISPEPEPEPEPEPVHAAPGILRGTIKTPTDEPLPGALVTITHQGEPVVKTPPDANGAFAVEGLAPGVYHVAIAADGFAAYEVDEDVASKSVTAVTYRPTPKGDGVEIVVTGQKPPREVTKHVIEAEEIRKMPGTNGDALRAIENMPGVARPPGMTGFLIVRGSGPNDTAIFVDGTQIPIAYHFGGLTSVVPSDVLDRIDFLPGNFGAEYGRAMGGIVDIGLRSPKKTWSGLFQMDLLDGRFRLEGPLGERTRFLVAARRSWVDAWLGPALEQSGAGETAAPVYYDGQLVLEHDVTSSTTVRLSAFGSSDRLALILNAPPSGDPITGVSSSVRFFRLQARSETRLSDSSKWINMVSWGEDVQEVEVGDRYMDLVFRPMNLRSEIRSKIAPGLALISGLDVQHSTATVAIRMPPMPAGGEAPSPFFGRPANTLAFDASWFRPAGYVLAELKPRKDLTILPGLRADYASDAGGEKGARWDVSPRVLARYDVHPEFPKTTLTGGVGVYRQPPQPWESVTPYGTPGLRTSRAMHYGAGFEQELTRALSVSLEGFYKDLRGLVVQGDAGSSTASGARFANTGTGRVYGAEILARWKNDGRFFGWVAYTLSRSERKDGPDEPTRLFSMDQTHIFTALGSYKLGKGWEVGARWRYVTGNPYTPYVGGIGDLDAGGYSAIAGAPWSARSEAFHRLDVRVEKTWRIGAGSVSAYLDLQNVYNRQNPEGRSYNYNYAKSQPLAGLPILPVLGLRGEL